MTKRMAMTIKAATRSLLIAAILCAVALSVKAQVSPMQGVGSVQFLDNAGAPLTSGVLYTYQAGTTTQQATYTDSTGTTLNPDPVPFSSGGRAQIWLTTGAFYKFVLCSQNDGAFCAPGDTLFSVDNVPGGSSGGGGGGGTATLLISASANPATSGVARLASGDSVCWRNASNSTNLCWSKDSNDLLSWSAGSLKFPEVGVPGGVAGFDVLWADNTNHRWMMKDNGGSAQQIVGSGVDINTSDQVTQLHFGPTALPLSTTAPTAGQFLKWDGTNIVGAPTEVAVTSVGVGTSGQTLTGGISVCGLTPVNDCENFFLTGNHVLLRFVYQLGVSPLGCSTPPGIGVRDITAGSNVYSTTIANGAAVTTVDSGALNLTLTAGHMYGIGPTQQPVGCSTSANVLGLTAIYQ